MPQSSVKNKTKPNTIEIDNKNEENSIIITKTHSINDVNNSFEEIFK